MTKTELTSFWRILNRRQEDASDRDYAMSSRERSSDRLREVRSALGLFFIGFQKTVDREPTEPFLVMAA